MQPTSLACENCGRPAGPRYCGHCGQRVEDRKRPLHALLRDLFAEWFSLDGKVLRTLRALVVPGRLTRLHLEGKRAPYVRPMRLYVVASVVLFSSLLSLEAPDVDTVNIYVGGQLVGEGPPQEGRPNVTLITEDSRMLRWTLGDPEGIIRRLRRIPPQELLDEVFAGLRRTLPTALILFLPLLALALKLLYLRTSFRYEDHWIFSAHFQSAVFLALSLAWLLTKLFRWSSTLGFLVYLATATLMVTGYLALALRRTHGQSWRWTLTKLLALSFVYMMLFQLVVGLSVSWTILHVVG